MALPSALCRELSLSQPGSRERQGCKAEGKEHGCALAGAVLGCSLLAALCSAENRKGLESLRVSGAVNEGLSGQREARE